LSGGRGRRRRAREAAFQALYQAENGQDSPAEALGRILSERRSGPEVVEYARALVDIVCEHGGEIDAAITGLLDRWDFGRLASVDRAILRVGAGELLYRPDVPAEVVIDEAIEIAGKYSTEHSGGFVNGVLDRLWRVSVGGAAGEGEGE
jgi:N utilization substance protein B